VTQVIDCPGVSADNRKKIVEVPMKSQDKPKSAEKKKPQKSLKEKRAEKKAKKETKTEE